MEKRRYFRVYDYPKGGYVVVEAKDKKEALKKCSGYSSTEKQKILKTTKHDYEHNIFSIKN